jgi:plasmid stabilization system protein ParE
MARALWTPAAKSDLQAIVLFIARRDGRRRTARSIYREIRDKCDQYADAFAHGSTIGTPCIELGDDFRHFTYKAWVVIFRPFKKRIEVIRIVHGAQDFPRLFH